MNRRDILTRFGIGAIIAPISGEAAFGRLLEPAKVELALPPQIVGPIDLREVLSASIVLEMVDGSTRTLTGYVTAPWGWNTGYVTADTPVRLEFIRESGSSPSHTSTLETMYVNSQPQGRCPYCRSEIKGNRCESCGASR